MAVLLLESFGMYPTTANLGIADTHGRMIAQGGRVAVVDLGSGRKYIKSTNVGGTSYVDTKYFASSTTIVVGFRMHHLFGSDSNLMALRDGGVTIGTLRKTAAGLVYYHIGGGSICLTTTPTPASSDAYYELKVVLHNTTGEVYLYRNGVLEDSDTGIDTLQGGSACDQLRLLNHPWDESGLVGISDLYADDAVVHGESGVAYEPCNLVGSSSDFTATGAATNHEAVDEVPDDADSTYNRSTTSTDLDQLSCSPLVTASAVSAVEPLVLARKENPGATSLKLGLKSGANHGQTGDITIADAYTYYSEIFEDVPGGTGWTPAELAAAEVSYENTS